ncbi:MAG: NAD(P)-binding domain-containing protein, partial [Bacteroidota bacterium]
MDINTKIDNKTLTAGIIGLGYVGLPLAVEFAVKNVKTLGFDISQSKIDTLLSGGNYIKDLKDEVVSGAVNSGFLIPSSDFKKLGSCDAIFICVPTPFTLNKDPDISHVVNATIEVANNLKSGQ